MSYENNTIGLVMTKMPFDLSPCRIDPLQSEWLHLHNIRVSVLRLDLLHPVISGNKLFKLHYFLQDAITNDTPALLSFGGAYSNHLVATAYAAHLLNKKSIGIVRGEAAPVLSHTLQHCREYGMQLQFVSRDQYRTLQDPGKLSALTGIYGPCTIIPEGGYHPLGAKGAGLILEGIDQKEYTHIAAATGTATTLAGLLMSSTDPLRVCAYQVLKGMNDLPERLQYLTGDDTLIQKVTIINDYHFGGYAKHTPGLLGFMNRCWQEFGLPLDFVYTGKMMYGVFEDVKKGVYPEGSSILCIHTGGLQGNGTVINYEL